ncbi:hypothetical protein [Rubripirellula lacrimiformis]|nr:hypothetical protein [Rubripirellula lacrimiformis]
MSSHDSPDPLQDHDASRLADVVPDIAPAGDPTTRQRRLRLSLREILGGVTLAVFALGWGTTVMKLRSVQADLSRLRSEVGYLEPTAEGQMAALRAPADQPLTYRFHVRCPPGSVKHRLAYSVLLERGQVHPTWFGAVPIAAGDAVVTVRIQEDPRDSRWKISVVADQASRVRRISTALPPEWVAIFRESHEVVSTGIPRGQQVAADPKQSIRVLDERWLVGEGSLLLYGDRPPDSDQLGVYAELQPDIGPL